MRLIFKQRVFSWYDRYDIYDEMGNVVFTVASQFSFGKKLQINDALGYPVGLVKQRLLTFHPTFELYIGQRYLGSIRKEFTFFRPSFNIDLNGWHINGDFWEWDYRIVDAMGNHVAIISKEMDWSDKYIIDVVDGNDAVAALMVVLAIDAEKDNRN